MQECPCSWETLLPQQAGWVGGEWIHIIHFSVAGGRTSFTAAGHPWCVCVWIWLDAPCPAPCGPAWCKGVDCSPSKRTGIFKISQCFNAFIASLGSLSVKATSEFCSEEEADPNSRSAICGDTVGGVTTVAEDTTGFRVWGRPLGPPLLACAGRDGNNSLVSREFCTRDPEPCPEGSQLCSSSSSSSHVSPGMAPCSVCHDPQCHSCLLTPGHLLLLALPHHPLKLTPAREIITHIQK